MIAKLDRLSRDVVWPLKVVAFDAWHTKACSSIDAGKQLISVRGGGGFFREFWHQNLHDKPCRNGTVCRNLSEDVFRTYNWAACLARAARVSETLSD